MRLLLTTSTGTAHVVDARSDALIHTLKDCKPCANGACASATFVLTAEKERSFVHAWSWQKEQPRYRCQAPERITSLVCTSDGAHCVGGGASGKLYLWEIASGRLLTSTPIPSVPVAPPRVADFDLDGVADVVIVGRSGYYGLRTSLGTGSLALQVLFGFFGLAVVLALILRQQDLAEEPDRERGGKQH